MRQHELCEMGVRLSAAMMFAAALAIGGCDNGTNGDDDGDGDDDPTPALPALVQIGSNADLRLALAPSDSMHLLYELGGHWAIARDSIGVEGGIQADSGPARFGVFHLGISAPLGWLAGSYPAQGAWILDAGPSHLETTVTPDAGGAGTPGVAVVYTEGGFPGGDTTLVWADFADLPPGSASWIRLASLGYMALATATGHLWLALNDVAFALGNDDQLVAAGTTGLTVPGDPFPGTGAAGAGNYRWLDVNNSGNLNPLDAFAFAHTDWWLPGPGPDSGVLLDGEWSLLDYIENTDPVIAVGGALAFTDLTWRTARREGATWLVDDPGLEVTGTGNLFVQETR